MYTVRGFKKKSKIGIYLKVIVIVICLCFAFFLIFSRLKGNDLSNKNEVEEVINKAMNDVVGISSYNGDLYVWGSGVVVSKNGLILTNSHVLGDMSRCIVEIDENTKLDAKCIWNDEELDLAIIKVDYEFCEAAIIAENDEICVGQEVYAIGNPVSYDFSKSVTKGIISGLNRKVELEENGVKIVYNNLIQTDADTNNGNSGGALINASGKVIGISTVKIVSADGMSFATPVSGVKPIIKKIEEIF